MSSLLFPLTLTLLVARVCADHAHHAFAADDATVLADATNGTTYFHLLTLLSVVERMVIISYLGRSDKGENPKKLKTVKYHGFSRVLFPFKEHDRQT